MDKELQGTMKKTRGTFLKVIGAIASIVVAATTVSYIFSSFQEPAVINEHLVFQNKLNIPPLLSARMENGEKVFDLNALEVETEFFRGKKTKTKGYNGSYLGPTIRVTTGDRVRMNVTNSLTSSTTVHWHGMDLPAAMDGNDHQLLKANENWQPYWTISNQAATLWYHSHLMGKTGEQVYQGLAGFFIIDDLNSDSLDLPEDYGVDDIPLAIQDRQFDANGQFIYGHTDVQDHTPMLGDTILVNGTYAPYADVPAKQVKLRFLNASNARRYNFGSEDNRIFYQIATDGGLLESPVARTRMILAPGERAEVVVDLTNDTKPLTLISDAVQGENFLSRLPWSLLQADSDKDINQVFKVLELRPQPSNVKSNPLPLKLNKFDDLSATVCTKTRQFLLDFDQTINGKKMDPLRVDEVVRAGDTEIWEIINRSGVYHTFHIHGVQFQILDRGGKPPVDYERGWKDTVLVSEETVRVIIRFPTHSDPHTPYMFHCHILELEDMGMMGQFVVVDKDTKPEDIYIKTKLTESGEYETMHGN